MYIVNMDCEYGKGCSDKATKTLTITFVASEGTILNLCDTHAIKAKKDFGNWQYPGDTIVVKSLS